MQHHPFRGEEHAPPHATGVTVGLEPKRKENAMIHQPNTSSNESPQFRILSRFFVVTLAIVLGALPSRNVYADDTDWTRGTHVNHQTEVTDEDGTWADANCSDSDSDSGAVTSYGIGLTEFDFTYPSGNVGCPNDSGTAYVITQYSQAGDSVYDTFYVGANDLSLDSSDECAFSYENRMHGKKCCSYETTSCSSSGSCTTTTGRDTSCDFDTAVTAASFVNTDGTVYFEYVSSMDDTDSDKHKVKFGATAYFPGTVFAAVPVLAGTTNALKDGAQIKKWKTAFPADGDVDFYLSETSEVPFSGEVYLNGHGEHLDKGSSSLGATLIGLPSSIPASVESAGGRVPIVAVFQVTKDNASCIGIYGRYSSGSANYACDDENSPNVEPIGTTIEFTVTDLASNQKISQKSTVFIQSADLEYNDYHHVEKLKLDSGQSGIAIDEEPDCSADSCSQSITFTPALKMESVSHSYNSDSYITVALLVLFEYEAPSD